MGPLTVGGRLAMCSKFLFLIPGSSCQGAQGRSWELCWGEEDPPSADNRP